MTFFTGIIVFSLAMISAYIARIFEQGQNRPIYWLRATRNIDIDNIDNKSPEVRLAQDSLDN
jgi:dolichol-phosphate mannosyltransferase